MPHQLGFQTARTNHIKSVCALHTDEEAKGAKGCKEDKNIFAFFATFCAFCAFASLYYANGIYGGLQLHIREG
jgi:hypothetical protein